MPPVPAAAGAGHSEAMSLLPLSHIGTGIRTWAVFLQPAPLRSADTEGSGLTEYATVLTLQIKFGRGIEVGK